jgi:predicted secreted protein
VELSVQKISRVVALGVLSALTLSGCTLAPEKSLDGIERIQLGSSVNSTQTQQPEETPELTSSPEKAQEFAKDPEAEIEIEDQVGDGLTLSIHEVDIARGNAFLVVYNDANLVVAKAFVTPQSQPVTISFDVPMTSTQNLQAALYLDDGDGLFDLGKDLPIIGEEGQLVHIDFKYRIR